MQVKTFSDLIEWTRALHASLAKCLSHCASIHEDERASMLLKYFASHETDIEKMVASFEDRADPKAAQTYIYDYMPHKPITTHLECDEHYANLDAEAIKSEVFEFHEQIINLYKTLIGKAEIPGALELMEALLDMEAHEIKLLVHQAHRMDEL